MKKYLMTGIAAVAMCAAFTSCSHDVDPVSQEDLNKMAAEKVVNNYNQAFIATFGQPAANQDWGFGTSVTRTANTNNNLWFEDKPTGYGLQKPADLFPEEIEYVMNWFSEVKQGHGEALDINNYFVQQVAYGNKDNQGVSHTISGQVFETFRDGQAVYRTENYTENSKSHMDWIAANLTANVQSEADCDHVNNFNTGSGSLMYMENSETKYGFAFKDSWGTENNLVSTNYYMVHLVADYKGKHIDGWYVGFDYQTSKVEMGVTEEIYYPERKTIEHPDMVKSSVSLAPDGIYNDRVVKIVPAGEINIPEYNIRVIAEDLNASTTTDKVNSDWDFNDVVFDVKFLDTPVDGKNVKIRVVAAGGTYPLYVAGQEVHALFGQNTDVMINTNASAYGKAYETPAGQELPVFYIYDANARTTNGKSIKVEVDKGSGKIEMTAEVGKPAAKIGVSPNFNYCMERVDITTQYPLFKTWVTTAEPATGWWDSEIGK